MSNESNPIEDLQNFVESIVFEKKEKVTESIRKLTLEEEMVNYSNDVLGIKVISVVLPPNYKPEPKLEREVTEWLKNKVKNNYISAHLLAQKYGEKLKIKLNQK